MAGRQEYSSTNCLILYEAFLQGKPSPLPPLALQYADFALWQRQWLQGEVLDTLINYWTKPTQRSRRFGNAD